MNKKDVMIIVVIGLVVFVVAVLLYNFSFEKSLLLGPDSSDDDRLLPCGALDPTQGNPGICSSGVCAEGFYCDTFVTRAGEPAYCGCRPWNTGRRCGNEPYPICGGECDSRLERCTPYYTPGGQGCSCVPVVEENCGGDGPLCGGRCPVGERCSYIEWSFGEAGCTCIQDPLQECSNMASNFCSAGVCPEGEECKVNNEVDGRCGCVPIRPRR